MPTLNLKSHTQSAAASFTPIGFTGSGPSNDLFDAAGGPTLLIGGIIELGNPLFDSFGDDIALISGDFGSGLGDIVQLLPNGDGTYALAVYIGVAYIYQGGAYSTGDKLHLLIASWYTFDYVPSGDTEKGAVSVYINGSLVGTGDTTDIAGTYALASIKLTQTIGGGDPTEQTDGTIGFSSLFVASTATWTDSLAAALWAAGSPVSPQTILGADVKHHWCLATDGSAAVGTPDLTLTGSPDFDSTLTPLGCSDPASPTLFRRTLSPRTASRSLP